MGPNIIIVDLETLPNMREALKVWTMLSDFPGQTLKATVSSIICFGYKRLGEKKTHCVSAWDFPNWNKDVNDDSQICLEIARVLSEADQIITHNGRRFDWKFLQTRLMANGMAPLPQIPHVDTCQVVKSNLYLFRNNLKYITRFLKTESKIDTGGWDLWVNVHNRDEASCRKMTAYCKGDIRATEAVYKKLLPLTKPVNHNLFQIQGSKKVCPKCGSTRLKSKGRVLTSVSSYRRLLCVDCGSHSRTDNAGENPR